MEKKIGRYEVVIYYVVYIYFFLFFEYLKFKDDKYWIFFLEKEEVFEIIDFFMEYFDKVKLR